MDEYYVDTSDEDEKFTSATWNRTRERTTERVRERVTEESKYESDIIILSDSDSDSPDVPPNTDKDLPNVCSDTDSDLPDVWSGDKDSDKDDAFGRDLPPTSSGMVKRSGYMKDYVEIKQETTCTSPLVKGKAGKVMSNGRQLKDNSSDELQVFEQEREADGEVFNENKASDRRHGHTTMDSESQDVAEGQNECIKEEDVELDDDYDAEEGTGNWTKQDEEGNSNGDASDSESKGMTLGDLWADTQSFSQVEAVEYHFEDRPWDSQPWDLEGSSSSPGADPAAESLMPRVSPQGFARSVPARDSPSLFVNTRDCKDRDAVSADVPPIIGADVPSTSDTDLQRPGSPSTCTCTRFLLKQALKYAERMELSIYKLPLPPDFRLESSSSELESDSGLGPIYKRPKKNYSAIRKKRRRPVQDVSDDSSCPDDDDHSLLDVMQRKPDTGHSEQSDARQEMKVKRQTYKDRRGQEKKQKVSRSIEGHSVSSDGSMQDLETDQVSTDEDRLLQEQGREQSGKVGSLSHNNPAPRLDEVTKDESMDTASDEDIHKEGRCLFIRKAPVVSESETDSDETCIDDDNLEASSSQAGTVEPEAQSSDVKTIDSNDGDCADQMLMSSSDVTAKTNEKLGGNSAKTASVEVQEEVSEIVRNTTVSASATPTGRTTLTLRLTPVKKRSRIQKKIQRNTEEDPSKEGRGNPMNMNEKNIVVVSEDSCSSSNEMNTGTFQDKSNRIKGSKKSNGRSGNVTAGASDGVRSTSLSHFKGALKGMTATVRLIPVKNVVGSQKKESKNMEDTSMGGRIDPLRKNKNDAPSRSEKAKRKTDRKPVSPPDEIKTGTFYGTSIGTKVPKESTSSTYTTARAESWDEMLRSESEDQMPEDLGSDVSPSPVPSVTEQVEENEEKGVAYPESMPFLPAGDTPMEINDLEYTDTQPFSPMDDEDYDDFTSNRVNKLGISEMTEDIYTQPFSPVLGDNSENLTNNAVDEEWDRKKSAAVEPKAYFPTDSRVSCQSSDEEVDQNLIRNADSETHSSHRHSDENSVSQQHTATEDDSPGQYFPTDSQLSIDLDSEGTKEIAPQLGKETVSHGEESQSAMSIPSKAHSSRRVSEDLDKNSGNGKKILPCQRNAWSPEELDPQQRFLLLQEGDAENMSFSQENGGLPSFPAETPSTSTAPPGNLAASRNEQHIRKKSKSFQRPSRSDNLLSTMKQTDQQMKKNPTKSTKFLQDIADTPSNPPILISKDPLETPSASVISSLPDCLQQPVSVNSSQMGPDNAVTATPNLVQGQSSVQSVPSPSPCSSLVKVFESATTQIGLPDAPSSASKTSNAIPNGLKLTEDVASICPSGSSSSSLVASDIGKPLKKRRLSQTSNIPPGNRGTVPTESTQITEELKKDHILSCILSWNTDWCEKLKEVLPAEVLQSFMMCKELPKNRESYPNLRSYQEAFICFLLVEMWSKVSCSVAKDCHGTWRQSSRVSDLTQDIIKVDYDADGSRTEPHGMSDGDLVLVDMTTVNASQKQFQFGLVQGNGTSEKTVCLVLHKSTIVPSSTRLKVVTSLRHYMNQITALLSFASNPLARHIIKPEDSHVFAKETQAEGCVSDEKLINSYMEAIKGTEVIRLMNGLPGTGKTTFLQRLVRWITKKHKGTGIPKTSKNPSKLLVCAPTGQSLDVLLRKIWESLLKHRQNVEMPCTEETMKHIIDGVEIVRVGKAKEADERLTHFLLSTVMERRRAQGSPYNTWSEDELQTKILQHADIVGCTLKDCGLKIIRKSLEGNVFALIVEDASHCLETEILLALQCRTKRVFMAGDQEQGIVHIRSKESKDLDFGRSMLQRLAQNFELQDRRIHRWETQYRMMEDIAKFPSSNFYYNRLKTQNKHPSFFLHPYVIFDVADGKESPAGESVINTSEVAFIGALVSIFPKEPINLGIITPSAAQKGELERRLGKQNSGLRIGTLTEFYGLEKDVIILCCTSTSSGTCDDNGFVMNKQVLNLALTRAKFSLIIVGNMTNIKKMNSSWKYLVDNATGRGLVFRTFQASYIRDAENCLCKDAKNCHSERTSSKPSASTSRPEWHRSTYSLPPQRNASEGRPRSRHLSGERQDGPSRRSEDSYRFRHNPGPQGNPAHSTGNDPVEADAVMPSGVNSLPSDGDSGSRSSLALLHRGNIPVAVEEQHVNEANAPRDDFQNLPSQAVQVSWNGAEQNIPSRQRHISGDAAESGRGTKRVHFEPGTKDSKRSAKLPRLMNTVRGESYSGGRSLTLSHGHPGPSSQGSVSPQSILKKPDQSVAAPSHSGSKGKDSAVIGHQGHHNLRSQSRSSANTAADGPISNASITPQGQRRNNQSHDSNLDTDNGRNLHLIATGMRDNERISRQQKGKNIAGRVVGKVTSHRSSRKESIEEHDRRERRPSGEAIGIGTSQSRPFSNGSRRGQNQSHEQHWQQGRSDQRSQRQCRQQPQSQHPPGRQAQRMAGLNQLANNPVQLNPNMLHYRVVHEAYGGRSTALTEPQPNIRRRKRSNSVKDRQMDYQD